MNRIKCVITKHKHYCNICPKALNMKLIYRNILKMSDWQQKSKLYILFSFKLQDYAASVVNYYSVKLWWRQTEGGFFLSSRWMIKRAETTRKSPIMFFQFTLTHTCWSRADFCCFAGLGEPTFCLFSSSTWLSLPDGRPPDSFLLLLVPSFISFIVSFSAPFSVSKFDLHRRHLPLSFFSYGGVFKAFFLLTHSASETH